MVTRLLQSKADVFYALLRIVTGLMFSFHGFQKVLGVLSNFRPPVGSQIWFGGLLELICGLAVAVGFFTGWAAFLASGEMAVAYIQFHWKLDFGPKFFPTMNLGELALLYAVVFLYIASRGGGRWSMDYSRGRGRRVS
jgi:putative oxidoreductase